jgi:hypothetical protein
MKLLTATETQQSQTGGYYKKLTGSEISGFHGSENEDG